MANASDHQELHGGAPVHSGSGAQVGVVGLLVSDAGGAVYAISHAGVGALKGGSFVPGQGLELGLQHDVLPGSASSSFSRHHQSICSLVAAYRVDTKIKVSHAISSLGGLGAVDEAEFPIDALGESLRLVVGRHFTEWKIVAIAGRACFLDADGQEQFYNDVVECAAFQPNINLPAAGGAVFFTPQGAPIGMLVGWREKIALVAPLRTVLWEAGLQPVSVAVAAVHNGLLPTPYIPDISPADPAPEELTAAAAPPPPPPPPPDRTLDALIFNRPRSYRFALLPLRPTPAPSEVRGLSSLQDRMRPPTPNQISNFSPERLNTWLLNSFKRRNAAVTVDDLRRAFEPLVLTDPDRPAREVMAALGTIDFYKRQQVVNFALERLDQRYGYMPARERTLMWWLVHDFLTRRDDGELSFDLQDSVFRTVSTSLKAAIDAYKANQNNADLGDEIFAMVEVALALPPVDHRDSLLRQATRWIAFEPSWMAFTATRLFLQSLREANRDLPAVIQYHEQILSWIRNYERDLAAGKSNFSSHLEHMTNLILGHKAIPEAEREAAILALSRFGPRGAKGAESDDKTFEEARDRDRAYARKRFGLEWSR